jgi:hypothetical protein
MIKMDNLLQEKIYGPLVQQHRAYLATWLQIKPHDWALRRMARNGVETEALEGGCEACTRGTRRHAPIERIRFQRWCACLLGVLNRRLNQRRVNSESAVGDANVKARTYTTPIHRPHALAARGGRDAEQRRAA